MSENTENKWRAENLGPRQAKQFNEALSAFQWETRTYTEITDHGEMSFTPMFGIGGVSNPKAQELMDSIKRVHNCTVTGDNYKQVVADLQDATLKLKETRPKIDKRTTPEERAEREVAATERRQKEEAEAAHLATLKHHTYDLPETAKAVKRVLLTLWPNTVFSVKSERYSMGYSINAHWTDGPTEADVKQVLDVFQTNHFDGMQDLETSIGPSEWNGHLWKFQGGYTSGSRTHSAAFLRGVAERFTRETGLDAPVIKEENGYVSIERHWEATGIGTPRTSCGWSFHFGTQVDEYPNGILSHDDTSHWTPADLVGQMAHHTRTEQAAYPLGRRGYTDEYSVTQATVYGILLGEVGSEVAQEVQESRAHVHADGITVTENDARDGVEIRFPDKPAAAVLDSLKSHGWRWSRFSKCWYHKRTPQSLAYANQLAGKTDLLTSTHIGRDEGLAAMTDVDSQYERQCEDATMP